MRELRICPLHRSGCSACVTPTALSKTKKASQKPSQACRCSTWAVLRDS